LEQHLDQLPLRELIVQTEHLTRELIEHLDQSFLPRLISLDEAATLKPGHDTAPDTVVRTKTTELLDSDRFTQQKATRLQEYLNAIDVALRKRAGT